MRSDILAQELKGKRDKKRLERKRRQNAKNQRAWYKRQKAKRAILKPHHPNLTDAEALALEEVIEYGKVRDSAHLFAPDQAEGVLQPASVIQPAPDCMAALAEFERQVAEHLKGLEVLKYGPSQPDQKISVPAPFDYPNGIIR